LKRAEITPELAEKLLEDATISTANLAAMVTSKDARYAPA
jgi:hypothetical protein